MPAYEYKVVPAPTRGRKAPGVKAAEARFALGLQDAMNEMAAEGWEYLRADILPSEERQGLTSSHVVYRSVLVFRRALGAPATQGRDDPEIRRLADVRADTLTTVPDAATGPQPEPTGPRAADAPEDQPEKSRR